MFDANYSPRADGDEDETKLPDEAAHIIVVTPSGFSAPAPEGYSGSDRVEYELGDEMPFEDARSHVHKQPGALAVLNEDGDILLGSEGVPVEECKEALRRWESGEGFDPSDYEA